ncbi:helix-turn-helix domain-containing protein [Mycobacterium sp.]|uniref:helix-turn-helix domain-containing protein n=1 Tax=Mycobacterium sp. TaxID=1785 RepID=UPI002579F80E|nr:helix-turn-helix domain-containing protein [Mycobacterium sp.]
MTVLPPWLTTAQVAEHCGVDRTEAYYRLLQKLEVRRIGVRGGAAPWGRLIRVERGSVLRMCGEPGVPGDVLPRWVTLAQAANYYQVSSHLIRQLIAHEQLDARRIGSGRAIRIDRDSLLQLGRIRTWGPP